jgi:predicted nucleic acid-binding protein
MPTVSNTSPISNLASIGRLDLLRRQFGIVHVPLAVLRELQLHPDPRAREIIQAAVDEQWLVAVEVVPTTALKLFRTLVHDGEAEALALAIQISAEILLVDEREARALGAQVGLTITGVLGILLRAKRSGQVERVATEISRLRSLAKFRVSELLIRKILQEAGEQE